MIPCSRVLNILINNKTKPIHLDFRGEFQVWFQSLQTARFSMNIANIINILFYFWDFNFYTVFLPSVFFFQTISYNTCSPSNLLPFLIHCFVFIYVFICRHILLNIACSLNIMLLICMCPGLTVWHQTTY